MLNLYDIPVSIKREELIEWRRIYDKKTYPLIVCRNMFCDLYALEEIWPEIDGAFKPYLFKSHRAETNDFDKLLEEMLSKYRDKKALVIKPMLDNLLSTKPEVVKINYNAYQSLIKRAQLMGNEAIEEIEYTYTYYGQIINLIIAWGAAGMMGLNKKDAFVLVNGGLTHEQLIFQNLRKTVVTFAGIVRVVLAEGHLYQQLPNLW